MNRERLDLLADLVRLHRYSLVRYLRYADPYAESEEAKLVLRQVSDMHEGTADRLESLILERNGELPAGDFSLEYTSLHDLALAYLLPKAVEYERGIVAALRAAVDRLDDDPEIQAVVEEALGEAKGHLESLEELQADVATDRHSSAFG